MQQVKDNHLCLLGTKRMNHVVCSARKPFLLKELAAFAIRTHSSKVRSLIFCCWSPGSDQISQSEPGIPVGMETGTIQKWTRRWPIAVLLFILNLISWRLHQCLKSFTSLKFRCKGDEGHRPWVSLDLIKLWQRKLNRCFLYCRLKLQKLWMLMRSWNSFA